jgi:hypothetical protein
LVSQAGVPHKGWACVDVIDLGEPDQTCVWCGTQEIRYVHVMSHPAYHGDLEVGCVCAEHMSDDYSGPRKREEKLKSRVKRRATWVRGHAWRINMNGNHVHSADGRWYTVIPEVQGAARLVRLEDNGLWSRLGLFATVERAKGDLFDRLYPPRASRLSD